MMPASLKILSRMPLFVMEILLVYAGLAYAEPKTPVEVVELFVEGYGLALTDEAADYTTARFRQDKPKSVWVVETYKTLKKL